MSSWVVACRRSLNRALGAAARYAVTCGVATAIGSGCTRHEDTPAPEPAPARPAAPVEPEPVAAQPGYAQTDHPQGWRGSRMRNANADGTRNELDLLAGEAKKPRDFVAELTRMFGDASACLQPRPRDSSSTIGVSITAHVMPSGSVSRGEVDSAALQEPERACLRTRLESVQFGPPIENAPFSVQASLQIRPKLNPAPKQDNARTDALGMVVTQAPSGEGVNPGVVPRADPGVVPPADPGVIPPGDPGVALQADPGVVPTPDPPAEVLPALPAPNPSR